MLQRKRFILRNVVIQQINHSYKNEDLRSKAKKDIFVEKNIKPAKYSTKLSHLSFKIPKKDGMKQPKEVESEPRIIKHKIVAIHYVIYPLKYFHIFIFPKRAKKSENIPIHEANKNKAKRKGENVQVNVEINAIVKCV